MGETRRLEALPNWPALMDEATGSAYLGVGSRTFRGITSRYKVAPVDTGFSMLRWRKADLDRMVDSLPARGVSLPEAANAVDPFEEALNRAKRRVPR